MSYLWRRRMIKDLFEILPVYKYDEKIDVSEWVKENQSLGISGEEIVKKFLEKNYNAVVTKMDDFFGYDLWVKIEDDEFAVEVKTTEEHIETFFLTITELLKAKKLGDIYNIYRVVKNNDVYKVYIINNPIKFFDIDMNVLEKGYENEVVKIYFHDMKVVMKDSMLNDVPSFNVTEKDLI